MKDASREEREDDESHLFINGMFKNDVLIVTPESHSQLVSHAWYGDWWLLMHLSFFFLDILGILELVNLVTFVVVARRMAFIV